MTLLLIFAALQLADIATTLYVLRRGGKELNPVMLALFDMLGELPALLLTKAAIVGAVFAWGQAWIVYFIALYVGVVAWNIYQIKRQKCTVSPSNPCIR